MRTIKIICNHCKKEVEKLKKEIDRQIRKGRTTFYCSMSCSGKENNDHLKTYHGKYNENLTHENRLDEFSEFREYIRRCKKRTKKEFDLTLPYLKELWKNQNGKCAYTNVDLIHPSNKSQSKNYNYIASIDRIDNTKGYIIGNVQYVSVTVNWLKNSMNDEHVYNFFNIIKKL